MCGEVKLREGEISSELSWGTKRKKKLVDLKIPNEKHQTQNTITATRI